MITEKQYRIAISEFKEHVNYVLESTDDSSCKSSLIRLKNFIDENEVIKSTLGSLLETTNPVNINDFLVNNTMGSYFFQVKIPVDIKVHVVTMYYCLKFICEENVSISSLGVRLVPGTKSKYIQDKIQHFVRTIFMPLFRYINNELEKGRINVEETTKGNINVTQTVSGSGNTVVFAGRDSFINGQALKENEEDLKALIQKAMKELNESNIDELEKEEIFDDLQSLSSEIESDEPKAVKFRKIKKSIDSFISGADETLKRSTGFITTLTLLATQLANLI